MTQYCRRHPKTFILLGAAAFMVVLSAAWTSFTPKVHYHSDMERMMLTLQTKLPVGDNGFFAGSGKCAGCHGIDPVGYANVTEGGEHVSATENWRATMMANSAKDPFWQAKVAHETAVNPAHAQGLINKCTSCHAPVGRYSHLYAGNENYSLELMHSDSLAMDGVSCGACHQQRMETLGQTFSGDLHFHTDTIWGPYISEEMDFPIFSQAMQSFVGYMPVGSNKVAQSEFCAGCHTLLTNVADLQGNETGETFTEQATYHEWLNSSYSSDDPNLNKECQGCHMPRLDEPIVIASGYSFLPGREPFGQHWLVGGNSFMLELMKNNSDTLGITATQENFDMVINRTLDMLQNQTAELELVQDEVDGDTARYTVRLRNKAGHKFPSGYPARLAYIEFKVTDASGQVIFHSGEMDSQFDLPDRNATYEPHYDVIDADDKVQIYEMVVADVAGNPTTVLERMRSKIKDNRLAPLGFSTSHAVYDTTSLAGGVLSDDDFNRANGIEGSGTDEVHFHVPVTGLNGPVYVSARLMYQSTPPRWMDEMFAFDLPKINHFKEMFQAEGPDPVQVAADDVVTNLVGVPRFTTTFSVGPNPIRGGELQINAGGEVVQYVAVYDLRGQLLERRSIASGKARVAMPYSAGTYLVEVKTNRRRVVERVIIE